MNFKTKDLSVTVLPKVTDEQIAKYCLFGTHICRHPTWVTCGICSLVPTLCRWGTWGCLPISLCHYGSICPAGSQICPAGSEICPGGSLVCPGGSGDPFVIQHIEDLVALRADLQETLKQLDAIQKEGLPSSITSRAEADKLEQGLTEALKQVRDAKNKLSRA